MSLKEDIDFVKKIVDKKIEFGRYPKKGSSFKERIRSEILNIVYYSLLKSNNKKLHIRNIPYTDYEILGRKKISDQQTELRVNLKNSSKEIFDLLIAEGLNVEISAYSYKTIDKDNFEYYNDSCMMHLILE